MSGPTSQMAFTPTNGYENTTSFPTTPASETAFRASMQEIPNQLRDFINQYLMPTTADITYYVSTTGNDAQDGLTSGTPLRTMQAAINKLPQTINHTVNINLADGNYGENVVIAGFVGAGSLILNGSTASYDAVVASNIAIVGCTALIAIIGINCSTSTAHAFEVNTSARVVIDRCKAASSTGVYSGVLASYANVNITSCSISVKQNAIQAAELASVLSKNNSGISNQNVLVAADASTIGKSGTQPSGTTAEVQVGGGVIR